MKPDLIPFPHEISPRGAPFRVQPSLFLHLPANPFAPIRPRAQVLAKQLTQAGVRTQLLSSHGLSGQQALLTPSPEVSKRFAEFQARPLRGVCGMSEGYRLTVLDEGILIQSNEVYGFYYAGQTLRQLLEGEREVPGMMIEDGPLVPNRAVHLDLRGWPPTRPYLESTLDLLSQLKFNYVILEYERYFAFNSQPGLCAPEAFPPNYLSELDVFARDRGITLIPLLHCLGEFGHLLHLEPYKELREDPRYFQQACPSHPETFEVYTAMLEDILSVHPSELFHIGGNAVGLLGTCPTCAARAQQLGGRSSLYLEYIGKVARYLLGRNRHPFLWDDLVRDMTDEQVEWLPPETTLGMTYYGPGKDGRAPPEMLNPLDRYKKLDRSVWGVASRLPTEAHQSFDNIDAWTEAAEMDYVQGLVVTTWTRDHSLGPLLAPPEVAWPGACYAAERAWGGRARTKRDEFFTRFPGRFLGVRDEKDREQCWAAYDLLLHGHPRESREFFRKITDSCRRNRDLLTFLDAWCALGAFEHYADRFEASVAASYQSLRAGESDPFQAGRLRWRIEDLRAKAPELIRTFRERALRLSPPSSAEEYLNNEVAYDLSRLEHLGDILSAYPLPDREWQQPVRV